ncbi:MAG: hypothetical protein V4575_00660 [Pseudomonadota bacterium]
MAYIQRDAEGKIIATSTSENFGAGWSYIEDGAKEYIEFLENILIKNSPFRESDLQLARVLEDLINILIERDVIRFTDLPPAAQKRLNDRQMLRKKTQLSTLVDDAVFKI